MAAVFLIFVSEPCTERRIDPLHGADEFARHPLGENVPEEVLPIGTFKADGDILELGLFHFSNKKKVSLMVGRDKPVLSNVEGPVLSGVEGLIPAYNVFLLIEKWN